MARLDQALPASALTILVFGCWTSGGASTAQGPSYSCDKVEAGSIEDMVCKDAGLSALDRKLAGVYAEASKKAANEHPRTQRVVPGAPGRNQDHVGLSGSGNALHENAMTNQNDALQESECSRS